MVARALEAGDLARPIVLDGDDKEEDDEEEDVDEEEKKKPTPHRRSTRLQGRHG